MNTAVDIVVAAIALAALAVSILANRNARLSAIAAERGALAAERQAAAAEAALPPPTPAVQWYAEQAGKRNYALRNVGTDTATGVRVVIPDSHKGLVRPEVTDSAVPAGSAFRVTMISVAEMPDLTELGLTWNGQDTPVTVPLPAAQ
jgi:hypothetical protein